MKTALSRLLMIVAMSATPALAQTGSLPDDAALRDVMARAADSLAERQDDAAASPSGSASVPDAGYGQGSYDQTSYSQPTPQPQANPTANATQFNPTAAAQSAAQSAAPAQSTGSDSYGSAGGGSLRAQRAAPEAPAVPLRGALPPLPEADPRPPVTRVAAMSPPRREAAIRIRPYRPPFQQADLSHLAPEAAIAATRTRLPAPPFEEIN